MTPAQVCWQAAKLIEKHGWIRRHDRTPHGYCIGGAIKAVADTLHDEDGARRRLNNLMLANFGCGCVYWNDTFCKSKAQAIDVLVGAAYGEF